MSILSEKEWKGLNRSYKEASYANSTGKMKSLVPPVRNSQSLPTGRQADLNRPTFLWMTQNRNIPSLTPLL
jgi:hypothetical protein